MLSSSELKVLSTYTTIHAHMGCLTNIASIDSKKACFVGPRGPGTIHYSDLNDFFLGGVAGNDDVRCDFVNKGDIAWKRRKNETATL